ncbi:hypothetical protein EYF80_060222 [Liparis tanakae]|uniref:Uncharacterized protein n=1 Tax=Liparis tanakae TaxID=230148 RepID=A0A4Z2ELF6_9TELE|nr:hypothetical protein EYF80_060222 [Liparis tanakae]
MKEDSKPPHWIAPHASAFESGAAAFNFVPPSSSSTSLTLLPPPSSAQAPPPLSPEAVLRPFITVAMATPQPFDSGPRHSSPTTHLLSLTPSVLGFLPSFLFNPPLPLLPNSLLLLSKHGFRTKITKSQRQVGHMMMGRPPEAFLFPQPLLKWREQS